MLTAIAAITVAVGCNQSKRGAPTAAVRSGTAPSAEAPSAGAAASAAAQAPDVGKVACKAARSTKLEPLATIKGNARRMVADSGAVFVVTESRKSMSIYEVGKDGSGAKEIAKAAAEPGGIATDENSVYYTADEVLYAVPRGGGEPKQLAAGFGEEVAVDGTYVFGNAFDKTTAQDRVVRMLKGGGEVKPIAAVTRQGKARREAGFAAIAADGNAVYVASSSTGQILRIPAAGGQPQELVGSVSRANQIALDKDGLFFTTAHGGRMGKVSRTGGEVAWVKGGVTETSPLAAGGGIAYALQSGVDAQHAKSPSLMRIEAGTATRIDEGGKVRALAADDECVYVATETGGGVQVLARGR